MDYKKYVAVYVALMMSLSDSSENYIGVVDIPELDFTTFNNKGKLNNKAIMYIYSSTFLRLSNINIEPSTEELYISVDDKGYYLNDIYNDVIEEHKDLIKAKAGAMGGAVVKK